MHGFLPLPRTKLVALFALVLTPLTVLLAPSPVVAARLASPAACVLPSPVALDAARDRDLRKLAAFQSDYGFVGNSISLFTTIPMDLEVDLGEAEGIAAKLKAFGAAGVQPVVFAEPPVERSLSDIADGAERVYWDEYFAHLKSLGVTDGQMGLWIPYPEINTPIWNRGGFAPADFARLIDDFSTSYRQAFPQARTGILLNSFSYEPEDIDWEFGKTESYLPYVKGIAKGRVDVVGIQAFPWWPRKNEHKKPLDDVSEFLFMRWATEAANALGTRSIMVHTGVPHSMHEGAATKVIIPDQTRARVMRQIAQVLATYRPLGYDMSLSLFLEDKSDVAEGTDWSFGPSAAPIIRRVAKSMHCNGIPLVLF